jgi:hypothetical protein
MMWGEDMVKLKLHLYYDATVEPFATVAGDLARILAALRSLQERGFDVELTDTSEWTDSMLYEVYSEVARLAAAKMIKVRKVFGSARDSGKYFGREVPALLVYEGGTLVDVYPKIEKGKLITIEEYLNSLCQGERYA